MAMGLVVATAGVASAHVTVEPESAPKGAADQTIVFRVPNESDTANNTGLKIQFPSDHPIAAIDPAAMPGWTSTVKTTHLATPIETDDGQVTDVVSEIDWAGGSIPPGQFGQFTILAMGLPSDTDSLTFKAIQTYDDGTETAWIEESVEGQPEPEHPAPVLTLTAAADTPSSSDTSVAPTVTTASTASTANESAAGTTSTSSSDSSKGLAIAGIVLGALALILAGAAFFRGRSSSSSTPKPPSSSSSVTT